MLGLIALGLGWLLIVRSSDAWHADAKKDALATAAMGGLLLSAGVTEIVGLAT